jgi:hypothetical protein
MKRKILAVLASLPLLSACSANSGNLSTDPEDVRLREKFRGLGGVVLVLGATSKKEGVIITNEKGIRVATPCCLGPGLTGFSAYGGGDFPIPRTVRATWREGGGGAIFL